MAIVIIALIALTLLVLAPLYGHDSRESMRSKELEIASYGMSWAEVQISQQQLADELAAALSTQRVGAMAPARNESRPPSRPTTATTG